MKDRLHKKGLVICMDEDIIVDQNVIAFGMGGSGVTHRGGGNQEFFPDEQRSFVDQFRPHAYAGLRRVAKDLHIPLFISSHDSCGWTAAQTIRRTESIKQQTVALSADLHAKDIEIPYAGHIIHSEKPIYINEENGIAAAIRRPPHVHEHAAKRIKLTVGGGITAAEKKIKEQRGGQEEPFFTISADYLYTLPEDLVPDAVRFIMLQAELANGIVDRNIYEISIHNGRRLTRRQANINFDLIYHLTK